MFRSPFLPAMISFFYDGVDFGKVLLGEEGEVFFEGGEGEDEGHVEGGLAEELAHERVGVGDVVEAVVVAVEADPDGAEDEDLPEVHTGASGGFFVGGLDGFEDGEDFPVDFGSCEDPLQSGEDGRELISGFDGDFDFFDGDSSEGELDGE
jgi:hypothetical protein